MLARRAICVRQNRINLESWERLQAGQRPGLRRDEQPLRLHGGHHARAGLAVDDQVVLRGAFAAESGDAKANHRASIRIWRMDDLPKRRMICKGSTCRDTPTRALALAGREGRHPGRTGRDVRCARESCRPARSLRAMRRGGLRESCRLLGRPLWPTVGLRGCTLIAPASEKERRDLRLPPATEKEKE